ncbi:hypothetical protein A1O1_04438 [Capronia coronata CBS 617.96]|uniref:RRM domain-containing protein n=1 Tax=Capronia coronata CBS 617.96 TaxID=1182541 RepID=W9YQ06_9EURO|nr:uncharacterized protein A1O1_04438 [Capronia coronata CBS 617.96]EXJ91326.1 hypothetical protein A1O1_04438 [Capronia coronata CBS 617.96]
MNAIRQTQLLNKRELENATPPSASWHADYRDTAYIYIGGLHPDLTEGDVVTIFSQFGNPTHLNLIRDKETGKSKGFGFLKYEDQRSCDLAVDNFTGAEVLGRLLRVDHTRYKKRDDEDEDTHRIDRWEQEAEPESGAEVNGNGKRHSDDSDDEDGEERHRRKKRRHLLKEEQELEEMLAIKEGREDEDPMREYLIREKREEVERARERERHSRHRHRHRRREDEDDDGDKSEGREERRHRHRHRHERDERHDDRDERKPRPTRDGPDDDDDERRHRRHADKDSYEVQDRHHRSRRDDSREKKSSRDHRSRYDDD